MLKSEAFIEILKTDYLEKRMTMKQISQKWSCSPATILNHLRKNNIKTREAAEYMRGRPFSEEHKENMRKARIGIKLSPETRRRAAATFKSKHYRSPNWKGGKRTGRSDGYIQVYLPDHPNATSEGYVMEHRYILEQKIGRKLLPEEVAHHINGIRDDNRPENLELMTFKGHMSYHMTERWKIKNGNK